jgi:hypothetical protein
MYSRLRDLDTTSNIDILFLGSSHSYRSFDTRIFYLDGLSTFNLGSSFQTPIQTEYLVEMYLNQLNPQLVVIETSSASFCDTGVESSLDIISNSKINLYSLKLAARTNRLIVYNTLLYSLYRDIFYKEKEVFVQNSRRNNDTYIKGGFVEKDLSTFGYRHYKDKDWSFNEKQFTAFARLIKLLNKQNIEFLMVQAPITSSLYNSYSNNFEFDNRLAQFGTYLNFNDLNFLDDSIHFYDDNHLNQTGVTIFDSLFINILKEEFSHIYNKQ